MTPLAMSKNRASACSSVSEFTVKHRLQIMNNYEQIPVPTGDAGYHLQDAGPPTNPFLTPDPDPIPSFNEDPGSVKFSVTDQH